jgi:hypothetical protein
MALNQSRYKDSHNPNSVAVGTGFELFAKGIIETHYGKVTLIDSERGQYEIGDALEGYEFKFDGNCGDTKRLSIEIEARRNLDSVWVPEGIYARASAPIYVQGNWMYFWGFLKQRLRDEHARRGKPCEESHGTVRKFYIQNKEADLLAVFRYLHSTHAFIITEVA